jgi:hypothetical protein
LYLRRQPITVINNSTSYEVLDTHEHLDVLAAIVSEDLRERMGFLDEGWPLGRSSP